MINRIQLLRNVGKFDTVNPAANLQLAPLTLVYAENGRGKTTLAAVLRSLATGDPLPIAERRRLTAQHSPHVILDCTGGPPPAIFQNNAWNRTLPDIAIFDDVFVDQNVYSGLAVGPDHRQNLHELILGAQGVALNRQLQHYVEQIETHNAALRLKVAAIPATERGALSVDEFCALPANANIDVSIRAAERNLAAAGEREPVRLTPLFDALTIPSFDVAAIEQLLHQEIPELDAAAAARVQRHLTDIGRNAEAWVADGMQRVPSAHTHSGTTPCPFCAQDLSTSPVIAHYRTYFSEAYATLKRKVAELLAAVTRTHSGEVRAGFERTMRLVGERRQFWSQFCDVLVINIDTALIARDWLAARDSVVAALTAKQANPLERIDLDDHARGALLAYDAHRESLTAFSQQLQVANAAIRVIKEQAAAANVAALTADFARLRATRARFTPTTAALCDDYLAEQAAKAITEQNRDQARAALDQYRINAFPGYQTAINRYLQLFNAGFRLDQVTSANTRSGPTCTYNVVINNIPVAVAGGTPAPGQPSFRNTLSAGDRNTLALAFFFASLEQDPNRANKVIVIDDPISSLDEHRSLTTVQELRRLAQQTSQVILLSHSKPFLCRTWDGADRHSRAALELARDGDGSTIRCWEVDQDCYTEHDRRHKALRCYLEGAPQDNREIARSIRPSIEAFLRVAYPEHFPPSTLLGPFWNSCVQRLDTRRQILNEEDTQELHNLTEYANRFHHDTNLAFETEAINDGELRGFVARVLRFTRREQ
jgi:wobble nucleotide-excising tRNase